MEFGGSVSGVWSLERSCVACVCCALCLSCAAATMEDEIIGDDEPLPALPPGGNNGPIPEHGPLFACLLVSLAMACGHTKQDAGKGNRYLTRHL